ncbi:hypothetical protein JDV02_007794 [Purpureocillium takamizusanense]|uniref:Uncharacterized protein n=1 Tax=Purpureocillium takamizusanense TaxID=2060973 RepID=A0A9Q8VEI1_9HYPO|nr:uncharacterized protein JDV02_007794 [Purpureocillium takamizusanense]UNI21842.1 hypothetical protein JDV02_007794 [Purpureocillium takamizusanense]
MDVAMSSPTDSASASGRALLGHEHSREQACKCQPGYRCKQAPETSSGPQTLTPLTGIHGSGRQQRPQKPSGSSSRELIPGRLKSPAPGINLKQADPRCAIIALVREHTT